jgi:hypothetical protein
MNTALNAQPIFLGLCLLALTQVGQARLIIARSDGSIHTADTWGAAPGILPVAGDQNTWLARGRTLIYSNEPFLGNLFALDGDATLTSENVNGQDPTFQNFTIDGGTISYAQSTPSMFSFGTNRVCVTAAGGRVQSTSGIQNADVWFNGGVWDGSGRLVFSNPAASDTPTSPAVSTFRFTPSVDLSDFTGTLSVIDSAILEIACPVTSPTITLELSNRGRYDNPGDANISVRALTIAGVSLPPGTTVSEMVHSPANRKPSSSRRARSRSPVTVPLAYSLTRIITRPTTLRKLPTLVLTSTLRLSAIAL